MRLRDLFSRGDRPTAGSQTDREPEPDQHPARELDQAAKPRANEYDPAPIVGDATIPDDLEQTGVTEPFTDPERGDSEPEPAGEVEDPRWSRAVELRAEFNRAMTLENTPAAFVSDQYDYSDDVWCDEVYPTPGSVLLERELGAHVRAHPGLFAGTEFETFAPAEAEHGEEHDRPPESAPRQEVRELDDDEFDAPF